MKAPEYFETDRLVIRRPVESDAANILTRYAGDREVTRFLGWPTHRSLDDTLEFLGFSDAEWRRWPAGPYLLETRSGGTLVGSTGLSFETPQRAATGYVLAKDAWGKGYATEALKAMVDLARQVGVVRIYALCHTEHAASYRVLEKCSFVREGVLRRYAEFPNLKRGQPCDVFCYSQIF